MSKKKEKKKENIFITIIKDILFFITAYVITISFIFVSTQVQQSSMEDTLFYKESLIEMKTAYWFSKPQRGDIVVFAYKPYKKNLISMMYESVKYTIESRTENYTNVRLIKRVIAVPGDTIDIKNGDVFVNDNKLDEPYVKGKTYSAKTGMEFPYTVQDDEYIVFGDNRQVSKDSRYTEIGPVSLKTQIEGKAVLRIWPFKKFGKID
jgi:signal peptidase I